MPRLTVERRDLSCGSAVRDLVRLVRPAPSRDRRLGLSYLYTGTVAAGYTIGSAGKDGETLPVLQGSGSPTSPKTDDFTLDDLLDVGRRLGLRAGGREILERIGAAIERWPALAAAAGDSRERIAAIDRAFRRGCLPSGASDGATGAR